MPRHGSPTSSKGWSRHERRWAAPEPFPPPRGAGAQRRGDSMKHAVKQIHFVGIGGACMSVFAEVLHNLGYRITGSDQIESATTRALAKRGIQVKIGHDAAHIAGAEAVVTSSAVKGDNHAQNHDCARH